MRTQDLRVGLSAFVLFSAAAHENENAENIGWHDTLQHNRTDIAGALAASPAGLLTRQGGSAD